MLFLVLFFIWCIDSTAKYADAREDTFSLNVPSNIVSDNLFKSSKSFLETLITKKNKMENKINEKKNEILNSLKGLTYKEFKQLLRMLENEVENTTTIN